MDDSAKSDRIARELEFQRSVADSRRNVRATPASVIARYRLNRNWRIFPKEFIYRSMGDLTGKRVLDYGCGTGEITAQLALLGAEVVGFDLSPDQIEIARERADLDGVASRVTVFAADGEELNLPEEHFDYVVVVALLHHTDFGPVMDRIIRCLRPGGEAFIAEPVAFSTTLGWLRDRAPVAKIVSPDERQLNADDVSRIRSYFAYTTIRYFNVLGRLQRLFLGEPPVRSGWLAWGATKSIHYIDRLLLSLPGAWRTAGYVVIRGAKAHR